MKEYGAIFIGTGSGMNILGPMLNHEPGIKVAVIDKDAPGGICLTRGCIPSKLLLYPADVLRTICSAEQFGIEASVKKVDFAKVMERMARMVSTDIEEIKKGLTSMPSVDYYPHPAEFTGPYTLSVAGESIKAPRIFLCTGSKPLVPPVKGLDKAGCLTSDTVLSLRKLPASIGIIGGGYIAAEYGHFFSAMGSKVTIIGRDPQFLPQEEPEVSALAAAEMGKVLTLLTNHEVVEVERSLLGKKNIIAVNRATNQRVSVGVDEVLVAVGRASNSDILKPERAGIKVDGKGWIQVNEYLETSVPNIWAFGDATGKHMFKHVANYESVVVYYNAILKKSMKADYHAVPHAVFTHPEIASVGLGEKEAIQKFGKENVLVGVARYEDTAKGMAMGVTGAFVKLLADRDSERLLGAHIIGPQASVLIQEVINLMYAPGGSVKPLKEAMHIHPALSEVVEHAAAALVPVELYYHMLEHRKEHQHDHAHGEGNGGGHQHEAASEGHDHGQGHAHGKGDGHSH